MKRREFLQAAGTLAGFATIGGVLWGRTAFAQARLTTTLVTDASSILVEKEHNEIQTIPNAASEEMKLWFTGACLNSAQFIEYICTGRFAARLGQFETKRDKEMCVENEFFARVLSHSAIYQRVDLIATESGAALDRNWKSCCHQIADKWKLKLNPNSQDLGTAIQSRLDVLVSAELDQVIARSANVADRPSILSSAIGIGKASLLVLPLATLPPPYSLLAIPAFALVAITEFAVYAISELLKNKSSAKAAISDRLALLGNRVALEFSSELRTRIGDLHVWQNQSLRHTAGEFAREKIRII